jgi:hypothetical protein
MTLIGMGILFLSCNQKPDCKSFKIGKFELVDTVSNRRFVIERNDSIQFEYSSQSKDTTKFQVTWTSDCEYYLTAISGNQQIIDFYKGKKLVINILETNANSYVFSAHLDGDERTIYQVFKRIK